MKISSYKRIIAIILTAVAFSPNTILAQSVTPMPVPMHGNWCGPGHPQNPARAGAPVDPLDDACMRHDYCIAVQGPLDCGCDLAFMQTVRRTPWPNPALQAKAHAIYDTLAMVPCATPVGTARKQSLFLQDMWSGNSTPNEVILRWGLLGQHTMDRILRDVFIP